MSIFLLSLLYYFTGVVSLIFFYLLGKTILKLIDKHISLHGFQSVFASLIIGLTSCVVVFSIIYTGFKTINTGFLLVFFFLYIEVKKINKTELQPVLKKPTKSWKVIKDFSIIFLLFFIWEASMLFKSGVFPFVLPHADFIFYSNISESLLLGGKENFYMEGNLYNSIYRYMIPYHYFEIWLNTLIVFFTGHNNMITYMLCVFPIFYFISWIGLLSLFEHFKIEIRWKQYLLAFLLMFTGGVFLPLYQNINFLSQTQVFAPFALETTVKKYATFYPFLIGGVLLLINNRIALGILSLLCLSLVSITAFPGVFGGMILFFSICFFFKLIDYSLIKRSLVYLLLFTIFIFCLYFYFNQSSLGLAITDKKELTSISNFFSDDYIRTFINVIGGSFIQTFIIFLPILFLMFLAVRYLIPLINFKLLLLPSIFFICIIFCSLLTWALLWEMTNAAGFYASSIIYLNILIIVFFIIVFQYSNNKSLTQVQKVSVYGFLILLLFKVGFSFKDNLHLKKDRVSLYSDNYIKTIETLGLQKQVNPLGAFILDQTKYANSFDKNTFFRRRGEYLKFLSPYKFATNINILEAPIATDTLEKKRETSLINLSVFYQFTEEQKKNKVYKNKEQSQLDFIDKFNISYLIADKNAVINSELMLRFEEVVQDTLSGEKFIFLKK